MINTSTVRKLGGGRPCSCGFLTIKLLVLFAHLSNFDIKYLFARKFWRENDSSYSSIVALEA